MSSVYNGSSKRICFYAQNDYRAVLFDIPKNTQWVTIPSATNRAKSHKPC
jgi:hypothetical protein